MTVPPRSSTGPLSHTRLHPCTGTMFESASAAAFTPAAALLSGVACAVPVTMPNAKAPAATDNPCSRVIFLISMPHSRMSDCREGNEKPMGGDGGSPGLPFGTADATSTNATSHPTTAFCVFSPQTWAASRHHRRAHSTESEQNCSLKRWSINTEPFCVFTQVSRSVRHHGAGRRRHQYDRWCRLRLLGRSRRSLASSSRSSGREEKDAQPQLDKRLPHLHIRRRYKEWNYFRRRP